MVETDGYFMAYLNDVTLYAGGQPGLVCRNQAEIDGGGPYGLSAPAATSLEIVSDPLDSDTDDDGIVDGAECMAGSAPDNDATAGANGVCIGKADGVGAACVGGRSSAARPSGRSSCWRRPVRRVGRSCRMRCWRTTTAMAT